MSQRRFVTMLLLVVVVGSLSTANADPGRSCDNSNLRLEGECYLLPTGAGACDPSGDGEHTKVIDGAMFSAGAATFMPNSGCGVSFVVTVSEARMFVAYGIRVGGAATRFSVRSTVLVDGVLAATAEMSLEPSGVVSRGVFPIQGTLLPPGVHLVTFNYVLTSGPMYGNLELDYLDMIRAI